MKANFTLFIVIFLAAFFGLTSCKSKDELLSLSKCEFRVLDAENITLGGVPIEGVNNLSDLNPLQLLSLAAQADAGELPLSMNILVEIRNPNKELAALNKAEWIFIVDERQLTSGTYEERVEIPGNDGLAVASVPVSANLVELLEGDSSEALINLALNLADIGEQPSRILFRVKPYIKVGNKLIAYPGYVDISTSFTSGE
jgi:hypothetical protein